MYRGLEDALGPRCYFLRITYSACQTLGPISVGEVEIFLRALPVKTQAQWRGNPLSYVSPFCGYTLTIKAQFHSLSCR